MLEILFNKNVGRNVAHYEILPTAFLENTSDGCFYQFDKVTVR